MDFLKTIPPNGKDPAPSDNELVAAYRRTLDLGVLARLFERYLDLLYGVCCKYLGDRETARDAVMDIFGQLPEKLARHEVEHVKAWLYTLAKNHCLMQLRASGRIRVQTLDPDFVQTAEEMHLNGVFDKEDRLEQLSACVETLSADQRTVVSLFYLENKCYKEIEKITGFEWKKVRSLIQNGRRNLRICMERHAASSAPARET